MHVSVFAVVFSVAFARVAVQSYPQNSPVLADDTDTDEQTIVKRFIETAINLGALQEVDYDQQHSNSCGLQSFMINFKEIGWNFVLAPQQLNINICTGSCKNVKPSTFYDHLITTVIGENSADSCIVDTYHAAKMIYIDEHNKVHVVTIPDFVAGSCRCA